LQHFSLRPIYFAGMPDSERDQSIFDTDRKPEQYAEHLMQVIPC